MSSPCDHHVGTSPIHVCTSCFLAKLLLGPTRVGEQGWVDKFRARGWVGQRGDSFGKLHLAREKFTLGGGGGGLGAPFPNQGPALFLPKFLCMFQISTKP